jgi:hypothetical protein
MSKPLPIQKGDRYGMLVVQGELHPQGDKRRWLMHCDCGVTIAMLQKSFASGGTRRSCGCTVNRHSTHGMSNTPEYRHWINMITRCEYPGATGYQSYGGRGIRVCDRWRKDFAAFYKDMGPRPSPGHSVDRIDVNGPYSPENCRWATQAVQARNTRVNHRVRLNDRAMPLAEAAGKAPVPYNTVLYRIKRGWSVDDAVSRPQQRGRRP